MPYFPSEYIVASTRTFQRTKSADPMAELPPPTQAETQSEFHIFKTRPAAVSAQWRFSLQVAVGEQAEWQGFQLTIERPCYTEQIEETKEQVIAEVKEEVERQKQRLVEEIGGEFFGRVA